MDLKRGMNHSCHHPGKHAVPLAELRENAGALHNTSYKKEQRRKMLNGERPAECSYCWEAEDSGVKYSDRLIKSSDPWAAPHLERVKNLAWNQNVNPTFLEVMLDDTCNYSCMYCIADSSTAIQAELKRFGQYPVHAENSSRRSRRERIEGENPFEEAFWRWLPEVLPGLEVLRVTGGEPLLSPAFGKLLDFLRTVNSGKPLFAVNTHLGHSAERIDRFTSSLAELYRGGYVRGLEIFTSADTRGADAEYLRFGMNYSRFIENAARVAGALPEAKLIVMCTYNLLSTPNFKGFLDDVAALKARFPNVLLDISSLRKPGYLRADIADERGQAGLRAALIHMRTLGVFSAHETAKLENVVTWATARTLSRSSRERSRADLFRFVKEYDRRKGRDFLTTFPDLAEFFLECKRAAFEEALKSESASAEVHP